MSAVSAPERGPASSPAPPAAPGGAAGGRLGWGLAAGFVVLVALGLRVWGIDHGLPYAYNADENAHFVPKAIGFFGHGLNPQYFVNPPGYTYLLHGLFWLGFGGREGVADSFAADPTEVYRVARLTAAGLGALAVWLVYLTGARLLDRRAGLLAAALLAVAFLPSFYSHLALNDVPALAPAALSLYGSALVLRRGRPLDFAIAGVGLGLACATKYTAGIVLLPFLTAAVVRARDHAEERTRVAGGLAGGLVLALGAFLAANPYALLDYDTFREGLERQSEASGDSTGKLGLTQDSGVLYYLWTLTWGLGWVPAVAAGLSALWLAWSNPRLALVLAPAALVFIAFMGSQERYFGRWLLPIFPIVCLLAAAGATALADAVGRRRARLRPVALAVAAVALLAQGAVYTVHNDLVLSRADTRNLMREWLVANVPAGSKIVVEPVVPDHWAHDVGRPSPATPSGNRWVKYITSRSTLNNDGTRRRGGVGRRVQLEDYERTTRPELLDAYERGGFCWVITGSTQVGRATVEPEEVPRAIAYYRELARRGRLVHRESPYDPGAGPVEFNFDWSFDYYPLAYHRPGADMRAYRLSGGKCA